MSRQEPFRARPAQEPGPRQTPAPNRTGGARCALGRSICFEGWRTARRERPAPFQGCCGPPTPWRRTPEIDPVLDLGRAKAPRRKRKAVRGGAPVCVQCASLMESSTCAASRVADGLIYSLGGRDVRAPLIIPSAVFRAALVHECRAGHNRVFKLANGARDRQSQPGAPCRRTGHDRSAPAA